MKIGILTFHSQLNYGGVLQCWALVQALKSMGHEVVVIDRWLAPDNWYLERGYNHWGLKRWVKFWLRALMGCGDFGPWIRHWRTKRFVKSLGITPYHFYDWKDLPVDLGVDCLVVGSDQVWHGGDWGYPDPRPYLLEGAPNVKAVAYAVSFGMTKLPDQYDYSGGFARFSSIGVRESEGVALVESKDAKASHVVDPTLLLDSRVWRNAFVSRKKKRQVVIYCLIEEVESKLHEIVEWAKNTGRTVKIISESTSLRPLPKSIRALIELIHQVCTLFTDQSIVKVVTGYGPREFVRAFAEADECITNSFHALMFSQIFDCNVRILRPQTQNRKAMFARLEEFCASSVSGNSIVDSFTDAMRSLDEDPKVVYNTSEIELRRHQSLGWLERALS